MGSWRDKEGIFFPLSPPGQTKRELKALGYQLRVCI